MGLKWNAATGQNEYVPGYEGSSYGAQVNPYGAKAGGWMGGGQNPVYGNVAPPVIPNTGMDIPGAAAHSAADGSPGLWGGLNAGQKAGVISAALAAAGQLIPAGTFGGGKDVRKEAKKLVGSAGARGASIAQNRGLNSEAMRKQLAAKAIAQAAPVIAAAKDARKQRFLQGVGGLGGMISFMYGNYGAAPGAINNLKQAVHDGKIREDELSELLKAAQEQRAPRLDPSTSNTIDTVLKAGQVAAPFMGGGGTPPAEGVVGSDITETGLIDWPNMGEEMLTEEQFAEFIPGQQVDAGMNAVDAKAISDAYTKNLDVDKFTGGDSTGPVRDPIEEAYWGGRSPNAGTLYSEDHPDPLKTYDPTSIDIEERMETAPPLSPLPTTPPKSEYTGDPAWEGKTPAAMNIHTDRERAGHGIPVQFPREVPIPSEIEVVLPDGRKQMVTWVALDLKQKQDYWRNHPNYSQFYKKKEPSKFFESLKGIFKGVETGQGETSGGGGRWY